MQRRQIRNEAWFWTGPAPFLPAVLPAANRPPACPAVAGGLIMLTLIVIPISVVKREPVEPKMTPWSPLLVAPFAAFAWRPRPADRRGRRRARGGVNMRIAFLAIRTAR